MGSSEEFSDYIKGLIERIKELEWITKVSPDDEEALEELDAAKEKLRIWELE